MKAIISYGMYIRYGKQYQVKFIYENQDEIKTVSNFMENYSYEEEVHISANKYDQNNRIIETTSIPNNMLLQFICELIQTCNAKVIIGNQEFTSIDLDKIMNAVDKLHINVTLKKGKYFSFKDCYYVTFKYSSDEQRQEVTYDFNINLNQIMGKNIDTESDRYMFPFVVDKNGKITSENTNIIGGTNIPEQALLFFLIRFVNEYNAVLTIGNEKFKNNIDGAKLLQALSLLEPGRTRTRKPKQDV